MKLLFDQNLSDRLVGILEHEYPGSVHVRNVGLARADDEEVWGYALDQGLAITSKDSDFHQRSLGACTGYRAGTPAGLGSSEWGGPRRC